MDSLAAQRQEREAEEAAKPRHDVDGADDAPTPTPLLLTTTIRPDGGWEGWCSPKCGRENSSGKRRCGNLNCLAWPGGKRIRRAKETTVGDASADCGLCNNCLDKPRSGGTGAKEMDCIYRLQCTTIYPAAAPAASSITPASVSASISAANAVSSAGSLAMRTPTKRKRSDERDRYFPPEVKVGEKVMKYFNPQWYEGELKRLPGKESKYFLIVYEDGDSEEIFEDDFWSIYSDWRVYKSVLRASEFVPGSRVVSNDGRLGVVQTYRPQSCGDDTVWYYRVHFTGWNATYDKWMPQVDLRKETPSTLKWAEQVRAANNTPNMAGKAASRTTSTPRSGFTTESSKKLARMSQRSSGSSSSSASSSSSSSSSSSTISMNSGDSGSIRTTKRTKIDVTEHGNDADDQREEEPYILPSIKIGTKILKYFKEGEAFFEGKVTKLPSKGIRSKLYHIEYNDGDEEDIEERELWMTFSDRLISLKSKNRMEMTKFGPKDRVFNNEGREAIILSFRPVRKPNSKPNDWTWSYLIHFLGWHSRNDRWIDEDQLREVTPGTSCTPVIQGEKKHRWRCHGCGALNDAEKKRCPDTSCNCWKDGRQPRRDPSTAATLVPAKKCRVEGCNKYKQTGYDHMCLTHYREANEDVESSSDDDNSTSSDDSIAIWKCHFCDQKNDFSRMKCAGCRVPRECFVADCTAKAKKDCDGMCKNHFREAEDASDSDSDDSGSDYDSGNDEDKMEVEEAATSPPAETDIPLLASTSSPATAVANMKTQIESSEENAEDLVRGVNETSDGAPTGIGDTGTARTNIAEAGDTGSTPTITTARREANVEHPPAPIAAAAAFRNEASLQNVLEKLGDDDDDDSVDADFFGYFGTEA